MVVDIVTEPSFKAGQPRVLLDWEFGRAHPLPDGEHFIAIKWANPEPITRMNVALNWFEELKQKVPVEN